MSPGFAEERLESMVANSKGWSEVPSPKGAPQGAMKYTDALARGEITAQDRIAVTIRKRRAEAIQFYSGAPD